MFEPIGTKLICHGKKEKSRALLLTATCTFEELFHDGLRNYSSAFEKKFKNVCAG